MAQPLLIVGASARAAAFSALRGGWQPSAIDLFADEDLARRATVIRVTSFERELLAAARTLPAGPWMYTGGLENRPRLVDRLAAERPLLGNRGDCLRKIRDPQMLAACLHEAGLAYPEWRAGGAEVPRDGTWLLKHRTSTGGRHVGVWNRANRTRPNRSGWYFQRRLLGQPCAAVFVARAERADLLGVTRQLLSTDDARNHRLGARPFCYAGSIGPLELGRETLATLEQLGNLLTANFALRGLFGVDFVLNDEGIWPVEVNPRFPASAEVLEQAAGFSAVERHAGACLEPRSMRDVPGLGAVGAAKFGKVVWFAPCRLVVADELHARLSHDAKLCAPLDSWPAVTDIPSAGTLIEAGFPIATLHAQGSSLAAVEAELQERLDELTPLMAVP